MKLLIVSYDAVGDKCFDKLLALPVTGPFLRSAQVHRGVRTVFVSNTYPVHTSVLTGLPPAGHGLVRNTGAFPVEPEHWNYRENGIRAETLPQAAYKAGLTTAGVFWPVTGGSKSVRWNVPEVLALPGESQLKLSMKYGSPLLQFRLYLKYRHLMRGVEQPELDAFSSSCMADIIRRKNPDLALLHLTAFDILGHRYGDEKQDAALKALDDGLGRVLEAAGAKPTVLIFSDHAQLPTHSTMTPNDLLKEMGLFNRDCFIECCGGSAFFHAGRLAAAETEAVKQKLEAQEGFNRWLTDAEMGECGMALPDGIAGEVFGFCAKQGFQYGNNANHDKKAQHGYPLDYPGYKVFYAVRGPGFKAETIEGGSLLDIAPLAKHILGL